MPNAAGIVAWAVFVTAVILCVAWVGVEMTRRFSRLD